MSSTSPEYLPPPVEDLKIPPISYCLAENIEAAHSGDTRYFTSCPDCINIAVFNVVWSHLVQHHEDVDAEYPYLPGVTREDFNKVARHYRTHRPTT
jgi:hypothetical protein